MWLLLVLKHDAQILPEPLGLCGAQLQRIHVVFKTNVHTRHKSNIYMKTALIIYRTIWHNSYLKMPIKIVIYYKKVMCAVI